MKFYPGFPCYNFLISIHYALQIVNAFGEFILIAQSECATGNMQSRWILSHNTGYMVQDTGYMIHDTGYMIQDTGYVIQDTRYRIQDT